LVWRRAVGIGQKSLEKFPLLPTDDCFLVIYKFLSKFVCTHINKSGVFISNLVLHRTKSASGGSHSSLLASPYDKLKRKTKQLRY